MAFFVIAVSFLSDFLDGKIARKFNMVTDWGKMLDPIAVSYQEDSQVAKEDSDEENGLFGEGVSFVKKCQHFVIEKVNPYLRFLF